MSSATGLSRRVIPFLPVLITLVLIAAAPSPDRGDKSRPVKLVRDAGPPGRAWPAPAADGSSAPNSAQASADTIVLAEYTFDDGSDPDPQGWWSEDRTANAGAYFHVDDFAGISPGTYGQLLPISQMQSLWCGARPSPVSPPFCWYVSLPGYGNLWNQAFESVPFEVTNSCSISFAACWDLEPDWDFAYVQYRVYDDGDWTDLGVFTGYGCDGALSYGVPDSLLPDSVQFRFLFQSDEGVSDEDGLLETDGAIIIDDIYISDEGGSVDYQGFEMESVGYKYTADGDWQAVSPLGFGDYAGLARGDTVLQQDPSYTNLTHVWSFFNGSDSDYGCGGHPEQLVVPYGSGTSALDLIYGAVSSPWIDVTLDAQGHPIPADFDKWLLAFDVYTDLPESTAVVYDWAVRSMDGSSCPGRWRDDGGFPLGGSKEWRRIVVDISPYVDPGATHVQVRLLCVDRIWHLTWLSGLCHTHAPLFDNVSVLRVRGDFIDVTSDPLGDMGYGFGVAWGDYDNDGYLDLYLANYGEANKLFRNLGDGTFADSTSGPLGDTNSGNAVAWGDYDNDGYLDLYLANGTQANKLLRNLGNGTFEDATSGPLGDTGNGYGVAWGDYDNDGYLDLYLVNSGGANKLLRNLGDGTFADSTSGPLGDTGYGRGVAWGDYDNDGDLDLYLANTTQANKLFRNLGNGTFEDATSGPLGDTRSGSGVAWGDYDNDGYLDLYLANFGQANKLFHNLGDGSFEDATAGPLDDTGSGRGVAWGDYDNDGYLDLYLANFGQANKLFRNLGDGTFADTTCGPLDDTGFGRGVAWGDYDNDGYLDLYLANLAQANKLFHNESAGSNWLQVKLVGTDSNASGIGARVRVVAAGQSQIREVSGGSGYGSQNSLPVAFGLGAATTVDSLIVSWPTGAVQESLAVAANQMVAIIEKSLADVPGTPSPAAFNLYGVYPNPVIGRTAIRYGLPEPAAVRLRVYDVSGRLVRALVDGKTQIPGNHEIVWDSRDGQGRAVSSGIYFYRLEAGPFRGTGRVVVLR